MKCSTFLKTHCNCKYISRVSNAMEHTTTLLSPSLSLYLSLSIYLSLSDSITISLCLQLSIYLCLTNSTEQNFRDSTKLSMLLFSTPKKLLYCKGFCSLRHLQTCIYTTYMCILVVGPVPRPQLTAHNHINTLSLSLSLSFSVEILRLYS